MFHSKIDPQNLIDRVVSQLKSGKDFKIQKVDKNISDLFFNSDLQNYNSLDHKRVTQDKVNESIFKDAVNFLDMSGIIHYNPEDLMTDFLNRV